MASAYSMDLRNRLIGDVDSGMSTEDTAVKYFGLCQNGLQRGAVAGSAGDFGASQREVEAKAETAGASRRDAGCREIEFGGHTGRTANPPVIASVSVNGVAGSEGVGHFSQ